MRVKMFFTAYLGLCLIVGITLFSSCSSDDIMTELDEAAAEERFALSLDCIITPPSGNPMVLQAGESTVLTGSPGSYPGSVSYMWDVSNSGCLSINGSNTNNTVTITAVGCDCEGVVDLKITPNQGPLSTSSCSEHFIVEDCAPPGDLCFDFWEVPKWFSDCYGTCSGGLDHVLEIHHKLCNGTSLPDGFTTFIHNVQLSSGTTFGNCSDCSNPILQMQTNSSSFNMAICSPLNHSMLIDIAVRDPDGNIVYISEDNYFSFFIPECGNGGF